MGRGWQRTSLDASVDALAFRAVGLPLAEPRGGSGCCGAGRGKPVRRRAGRDIGIDWGVKETATTTGDAHDLPHAQHGKNAAQRLARYQRMMARRKPERAQAASNGYREAKRQTAKVHKKKVARQREDTGRKRAKAVVRDHDQSPLCNWGRIQDFAWLLCGEPAGGPYRE